jgi:hypothetical protein
MKSLKIKNKEIKIQNINEIGDPGQGEAEAFANIISPTLKATKNVALTAAQISKNSFKLIFSPISYIAFSYWNGSKPSFKGWLKNARKNLTDFGKDIDNLGKKYDKDFNDMLRDIGLTEGQMNVLLFAGSPPLAVANIISNMTRESFGSSGGDSSTTGLKDKNTVIEKMGFLLTMFLCGSNPSTNKKTEELYRQLKTDIKKFIEAAFGENTLNILKNIHLEKYWNTHSAEIVGQIKDLAEKIKLDEVLSNPVEEVKRLDAASINVSALDSIITNVKNYCDNNIGKINDVYTKKLNLKTNLIIENTFSSKNNELEKMAFCFAYILYVKNKPALLELVLNSDLGQGNKVLKDLIEDAVNVREGKQPLMNHLNAILGHYLSTESLLRMADSLIKDEDYNETLNLSKLGLPTEATSEIKATIDKLKNKLDNLNDKGEKIDFVVTNLNNTKRSIENKESAFNYDFYKNGVLFNKLKDGKLLVEQEENLWSAVNKQSKNKNNVIKKIEDTIKSLQKKKSDDASSSP